MSINFIPPSVLTSQWDTHATNSLTAGHTPSRRHWRIARDVFIADTNEEARRLALDGVLGRDCREYFIRLLTKTKQLGTAKIDQVMPDSQVTPEYLCDNIWIVGDVDTVTAKLRRLYDDVGGFGTVLWTKTHSRPHVSNDNPYSEAQFKTFKYRPGFPERFTGIEHARSFGHDFIYWYNTEHRYMGIGLMTPEAVHYRRADELATARAEVLR